MERYEAKEKERSDEIAAQMKEQFAREKADRLAAEEEKAERVAAQEEEAKRVAAQEEEARRLAAQEEELRGRSRPVLTPPPSPSAEVPKGPPLARLVSGFGLPPPPTPVQAIPPLPAPPAKSV